jgi:hypothetical protein
METKRVVKLSTSEIANLWTVYMNDSMASCVMKQFLQHIEDKQIEEVVRYGLSLSQQHIVTVTNIFSKEGVALPVGFNEQDDVDLSSPRLFSDTYYLFYLHNMAKVGGNAYSLALANSAREDILTFFTECTESTMELFNKTTKILLSKGLFIRPPQISYPKKVDYVHKQGFLVGWFGERRPLNSIEVMNLFFNIERNTIGKSLVMGFSQAAKTKEVVQYFQKANQISGKHIEVFSSLLSESNLPASMTWDTHPTESTAPTFSEKLMMFHIAALTAASLSHYGTSLGSSPRRDLGVHYTRLMQEVGTFAEDGANIMINNGWMEQPPMSSDREALAQK